MHEGDELARAAAASATQAGAARAADRREQQIAAEEQPDQPEVEPQREVVVVRRELERHVRSTHPSRSR